MTGKLKCIEDVKDEGTKENKGESIVTKTNVNFEEVVVMIDTLAAKLAEMGSMQENMAVKLAEMGTMQENMIVKEERMYDIGTSEAWQANMKRMYDEYQEVGIESIKRSRTFADQIIQNAIETANMTSKQAIRHGDIAIKHQWQCGCADIA